MEEGRRKEGGRGLQNNDYDADRNRKTRTETEIKKIVMIMLLTMVTVDDNVHMNTKMMIVNSIKIMITTASTGNGGRHQGDFQPGGHRQEWGRH